MKIQDQEKVLPIDAATLSRVAGLASGYEGIHIQDVQVQDIWSGFDIETRVQRISGKGIALDETVPWQAIVKTYFAQAGKDDPQGANYWKREASYFSANQLDHLPTGIRTPRCYAIRELNDQVQIIQEDLEVSPIHLLHGSRWQMGDYRAAARCLGSFNGAYLANEVAIPTGDWVPRHWLRAFVEASAPSIEIFFHSLDHPIIRKIYAPISPDFIHKAWDERHTIFNLLESLPQTFCHQDAFSLNLFLEPEISGSQLIAIDWSLAGPAAVGSELSTFVFSSLLLHLNSFEHAEELSALAIEGYLEGLKDTGYVCDPDLVRVAFYASTFWRFLFGAYIGAVPLQLDEASYSELEKRRGVTMDQFSELLASGIETLLPMYSEIWRLAKALNLKM